MQGSMPVGEVLIPLLFWAEWVIHPPSVCTWLLAVLVTRSTVSLLP